MSIKQFIVVDLFAILFIVLNDSMACYAFGWMPRLII